jgi:4-amino-4-deoxychorismate lyase
VPDGLRLIETFRWGPSGFVRLPAHLARMAAGAEALGVPFDRAAVDRVLATVGGDGPLRVRLTLGLDGVPAVAATPLGPPTGGWRVVLAGARLRSDDPWLRLKSSARATYDAVRAGLPAGVDEAVLLNERGEVCDGTITTVFLDRGAGLVTPPLACGVLPGVLRAEMLQSGACREAVLGAEDLGEGRLFVGNSLRGLVPARLT